MPIEKQIKEINWTYPTQTSNSSIKMCTILESTMLKEGRKVKTVDESRHTSGMVNNIWWLIDKRPQRNDDHEHAPITEYGEILDSRFEDRLTVHLATIISPIRRWLWFNSSDLLSLHPKFEARAAPFPSVMEG
ncbi:hypothetical protein C0J52_11600 [Blattella germanica]|nr:hypothetical protein C0J52_11600 [Blattella germanica]